MYYSVHKYLFVRDSFYWANRLDAHLPSDTIVLKDVTQVEFDALLSVLYSSCVLPTLCSSPEPNSPYYQLLP